MTTEDRLEEILAAFGSRKIVVVGDFFLDKYLEFDPSLAEISLETGKIANQVVNVRHSSRRGGHGGLQPRGSRRGHYYPNRLHRR